VIRNMKLERLVADEWNDFSRVIVRKGAFYTWGLSRTYTKKHPEQYDLLIEGVAGTQIQEFPGDVKKMDFFAHDIASLPHLLKPTGSTLVLGVGAGFDVLMARFFDKAPIVGVEVNPLVGRLVNETFGAYSGRPYHQPGVKVHFENARTYVKRDPQQYDVVTVTWVDSGAATGAGAFALTENYLYTVEAFRDYLARTKDDGVLAFMRARYSPEYDAIKGIGVAVEALRSLGVQEPGRHLLVTSVASPHFGGRELTHVMLRRKPFTDAEIAVVDGARQRLEFTDLYTPGRGGDAAITRLITDPDRKATYASFPFDMEPNPDDRPFYFFLRAIDGKPAGGDVQVLRQSLVTIFLLIGAFLLIPLLVLLRRGVGGRVGVGGPQRLLRPAGPRLHAHRDEAAPAERPRRRQPHPLAGGSASLAAASPSTSPSTTDSAPPTSSAWAAPPRSSTCSALPPPRKPRQPYQGWRIRQGSRGRGVRVRWGYDGACAAPCPRSGGRVRWGSGPARPRHPRQGPARPLHPPAGGPWGG
jgi:hypothetical protein